MEYKQLKWNLKHVSPLNKIISVEFLILKNTQISRKSVADMLKDPLVNNRNRKMSHVVVFMKDLWIPKKMCIGAPTENTKIHKLSISHKQIFLKLKLDQICGKLGFTRLLLLLRKAHHGI